MNGLEIEEFDGPVTAPRKQERGKSTAEPKSNRGSSPGKRKAATKRRAAARGAAGGAGNKCQGTKSAASRANAPAAARAGPARCACCFEEEDSDDESDDRLLECHKCGLCVHEGCFEGEGLAAAAAKRRRSGKKSASKSSRKGGSDPSAWTCRLCAAGVPPEKPVECKLCTTTDNRAMKRLANGRGWVHVTCVLWIREMYFEEPEVLEKPAGLKYVPDDRWKLVCTACHEPHGAPMQCAVPSCTRSFHPLCAYRGGWQMDREEDSSGRVKFKGFCELHGKITENTPCFVCDSTEDAARMLLCDECDKGFHMDCLSPPLTEIPEGEWYCKPCLQRRLVLGTIVALGPGDAGSESEDDADSSRASKRRRKQGGSRAPKRRATAMRTRYVALTDEYVASLPTPPALVSDDELDDDKGSASDGSSTSVGSGSGTDEAGSSDSEAESDLDETLQRSERQRSRSAVASTIARRSEAMPKRRDDEAVLSGRTYFAMHRSNGRASSNARFSDLAMPSDADVARIIASQPVKHAAQRAVLARHYRSCASAWALQLRNDYSLLFYGLGSKKDLLESFAASVAVDGNVVVVNGFVERLTVKDIAAAIGEQCLGQTHSFHSAIDYCQFLARHFSPHAAGRDVPLQEYSDSENDGADIEHEIEISAVAQMAAAGAGAGAAADPSATKASERVAAKRASRPRHRNSTRRLFLVIHNIDGPGLRSHDAQTALSILAAATNIHLIASVDHVNSATLFDQRQRDRYNWLWHDVTTFAHYVVETSHSAPVAAGKGHVAASGIKFVLQSLTPSHRSVLRILVDHHQSQLEAAAVAAAKTSSGGGGGGGGAGVSTPAAARAAARAVETGLEFADLFEESLSAMLVTTDSALRNLLVELQDHELVTVRRDAGRRDVVQLRSDKVAEIAACTQGA